MMTDIEKNRQLADLQALTERQAKEIERLEEWHDDKNKEADTERVMVAVAEVETEYQDKIEKLEANNKELNIKLTRWEESYMAQDLQKYKNALELSHNQLSEKTAEVERLLIKVMKQGDSLIEITDRCARLEGLLKRAKYYVPDEANTLLVEISSALESKE